MMPLASELRRDFLRAGGDAPAARLDEAVSLATLASPDCAVIGAFDGFHLGHAALIEAARAACSRVGAQAPLIVTFDPDPDCVVAPAPAPKLMTTDDRIAALRATGCPVLIVPFTPEVAAMDAEGFFAHLAHAGIRLASVHVGSDFRLGAGAVADVAALRAWGAARGIEVCGHELVRDGGEPVSATRIRALVAAGDVEAARRELGRRFMVRGRVVSGRGEGTGMGFPTANVEVPAGLQLPADGVYAALALVGDTVWPAAVNAGVPPMFADRAHVAHLEANLLGFSGDLYGRDIALAFCRRLRPSVKFASVEALIERVMADIEDIRGELGEKGVRLS